MVLRDTRVVLVCTLLISTITGVKVCLRALEMYCSTSNWIVFSSLRLSDFTIYADLICVGFVIHFAACKDLEFARYLQIYILIVYVSSVNEF